MAKQKQQQVNPEDFTPEEQQQIQHFGQALVQGPTDFDDEVEKELAKHYPREASHEKMKAAQTGGSGELGPTEIEQQAVGQQQALAQQATTAGAQAAQQAQGAQTSPAPTGPAGVSQPYRAQRASQSQAPVQQPSPAAQAGAPPLPPPEAPSGPSEEEES